MGKIYGHPRLGGKTKILQQLLIAIEGVATEKKYKYFLDVCVGGMKIVGNINHALFDAVIANDIEPGISALATVHKSEIATKQMIAIINNKILEYEKNPKDLFKEARTYLTKKLDDRLNGKELEIDTVLAAAYTVIVTYSHHKNCEKEFSIHNFNKNFYKRQVHMKMLDYNVAFSDIIVKNEDLFDFLNKYGGCEDMLIYADVPYHPDSMSSKNHYNCNLTKEDHQRLCRIVTNENFKATIIISGWKNDDYKEILEKSGKISDYFLGEIKLSSGNGTKKEEWIWSNTYIPSVYLPKRENKKPVDTVSNNNDTEIAALKEKVDLEHDDDDDDYEE